MAIRPSRPFHSLCNYTAEMPLKGGTPPGRIDECQELDGCQDQRRPLGGPSVSYGRAIRSVPRPVIVGRRCFFEGLEPASEYAMPEQTAGRLALGLRAGDRKAALTRRERKERWGRLLAQIKQHDVVRWRRTFVEALAKAPSPALEAEHR